MDSYKVKIHFQDGTSLQLLGVNRIKTQKDCFMFNNYCIADFSDVKKIEIIKQ